jgi:hypothetical protein
MYRVDKALALRISEEDQYISLEWMDLFVGFWKSGKTRDESGDRLPKIVFSRQKFTKGRTSPKSRWKRIEQL